MIGDGMGSGHIQCKKGFLASQTQRALVTTSHPAINGWTAVDSPAAATAYSCGIVTKNGFAAMTPDGKPCETVAQKAHAKGYTTLIATNDSPIGGTPSSFFAHSTNRYDEVGLRAQLATTPVTVIGGLGSPAHFVSWLMPMHLNLGGADARPFFAMIEEAAIDWTSHDNNFEGMIERMEDFENAVQTAIGFVESHPNITLIVTGDHETGGLNPMTCQFTTGDHTPFPVPLYAYGAKAHLFSGMMDNTEVHARILEILFP
jgi:alkaline phosphatase